MKLTMILLTALLLNVSAHTSGQTVSLSEHQASLKKIFSLIEKQTKYIFFIADNEVLRQSPLVDVNVKDVPVTQVLDIIFSGQKLSYQIFDNVIGIRRTTASNRPLPGTGDLLPPAPVKIRVIDTDGHSLSGATIKIKNSKTTGITNDDGVVTLQVYAGDVIAVSYVGFQTTEYTISSAVIKSSDQQLTITLKQSDIALSEVVVNKGYYTESKRLSTGNISKVSSKEIEKQTITNPLLAIQGRMPGVTAIQSSGIAGTGINIQIRGQNSLRNSSTDNGNYPLYIVDGVPVTSSPITSYGALLGIPGIDPLRMINPADIESIEILKDADATAIYGSRGANGVVLITTKKGKAGSTNFDVQVYHSFGEASGRMDLMNTGQYLAMRREALANDGLTPVSSDVDLNGTWDQKKHTDWQELLFGGTANTTNLQASVSGGNGATSFRLGGSYYTESTIFPGDFGYTKGTGNLNVNHISANQKFRVSGTVNYGIDKNNLFNKNIGSYAITLAPNAPGLDAKGAIDWTGYQPTDITNADPYSYLRTSDDVQVARLVSSTTLNYEIGKGLQVEASLGYTNIRTEEWMKTPKSSLHPGTTSQNKSALLNQEGKSWIAEPKITYRKEISRGRLDMLIGTTFQESIDRVYGAEGNGYASDGLLGNIIAAATKTIVADNITQYRYNAIYGRIGYNWKEKYILNLTGRRDGSSRFGPGKQFGNFGAAGAAWIFSNEKFFGQLVPAISFGKLRTSYGITGNDNIANYGYLSTYTPNTSTYQGTSILNTTALANSDFAWETNKKLEIAFDLGFLKNRINFSASWYLNRSSNQLVGYPLPAITGFTTVQYNLAATVQNTGTEIELRTLNVQNRNFKWSTYINMTIPENKLVSYPDIENSTYANTYVVGQPLTISKRYQYTGINPSTGFYEVLDADRNGSFTNIDRIEVVNLGRKYYGGIQNTVAYKSFELDFLLEFVSQKANNFIGLFTTQPGRMSNQLASLLSEARWKVPGDEAEIQKFTTLSITTYTRARSSDFNQGDASYMRLKTLSLTYQLQETILKRVGMKDVRLYLQAQNLFTITDYFGFNPESPFLETPPLRMITTGIILKF